MISIGARVRVHYNLHRGDFSVIDKTGRVICNVETITLRDVEFRVSEAGRARTVARNRRTVHAYAVGYVLDLGACDVSSLIPVTYNPHRAAHFHVKGNPASPVWRASRVTFANAYCYASEIDAEKG